MSTLQPAATPKEIRQSIECSKIRNSLETYFGKQTIRSLIDSKKLVFVTSETDVRDFSKDTFVIDIDRLASKKDPVEGQDVPEGFIAQVYLKGMKGFPSGPVVLANESTTGNNLGSSFRSSLPDILNSSISVFRVDAHNEKGSDYLFYSRRHGRTVVTTFNQEKNRFEIRGVLLSPKHPVQLWGNDFVRLSASFQLSDSMEYSRRYINPELSHGFSVGTVVTKLDSGVDSNNRAGARFEKPYIVVDYKAEIKRALGDGTVAKTTAPAVLLHEIGVHMAHDGKFKEQMQSIIDAAPEIMDSAAKKGDLSAKMAKEKIELAGIKPTHPNYKEEVCAYLVESCALKQAHEPKLVQWFQSLKSNISVWMFRHGFKDSRKLSSADLVVIAKANMKALSRIQLQEQQRGHSVDKGSTTTVNTDRLKTPPTNSFER